MKKVLAEIQSGSFAREFILENQANRPVFNARLKQDSEHPNRNSGRKTAQDDAFYWEKTKIAITFSIIFSKNY